jgi:hypothetical protein
MWVVPGKRRCRFHGGLSTGPKTNAGSARIAEVQRRRWKAFRGVARLSQIPSKTPQRARACTCTETWANIIRLECSVQQECYRQIEIRGGWCRMTNPVVSLLVEIDLDANTWVEFGTFKNGTQASASGNLKSVTQSEIVLNEKSYADKRTPERTTISRLSGAYSSVQYDDSRGFLAAIKSSGTCNKTTKPLPSAKF